MQLAQRLSSTEGPWERIRAQEGAPGAAMMRERNAVVCEKVRRVR